MDNLATAPVKFDLDTARRIVGDLADLIRPACERLVVGGSIRRGTPYVKDAELIAIPARMPAQNLLAWLDGMVERGYVEKALYGDKQTTRWGSKYRGMLFQGIKVELFLADEDNFGYQFWLRSGPAEANTYVMKWLSWKQAPIRPHDGYWWWGDKQLRVASEEDLFMLLGLPFVAPNLRTEQRYKLLLNSRNHRWPDFAPFVVKATAPLSKFDDEQVIQVARVQRNQPPAAAYGLLSLSEFRRFRDEQAQASILERQALITEGCEMLGREYRELRRQLLQTTDRNERDALEYALYEPPSGEYGDSGGIAWQWARVDAELEVLRKLASG